jgi:hypothetical protein
MKNGKNIILCCILALAIGISAIVPLAFFMNTAKAQTDDEQWFSIDITSAYFNAGITEDALYQIGETIVFDALINSDALSQQVNARVEYFELTFYAENLQLSKSYQYLGMDRPGLKNATPFNALDHEAWYKIPWLNVAAGGYSNSYGSAGGMYAYNTTNAEAKTWQNLGSSSFSLGGTDKHSDAILTALKNAQTIYLDVRRVAYITYDDNGAVTTFECDQFIQRIELTKNSNGEFTFGDSSTLRSRIISDGSNSSTFNGVGR